MSLEDLLLGVEDGREEYFGRWSDEIRRFDRKDLITRLAAYWALTERYVADLKGKNRPSTCLRYEKLCVYGGEYLHQNLDQIISRSPSCWCLQGNSATTYSGGKKTKKGRLKGWKDELNTEVIHRIETVVDRFGMSHTLDLVDQY